MQWLVERWSLLVVISLKLIITTTFLLKLMTINTNFEVIFYFYFWDGLFINQALVFLFCMDFW